MELWSWYINLFSDTDNRVVIAAWAATIATLSFILTFLLKPLFYYIKQSTVKIKVEMGMSHQIVTSILGVGTGTPLLTCTITNHSGKTVYIKNPAIKSSQTINGDNKFVVPRKGNVYPMKLESGQQITIDYDTISLYNQLLSHILDNSKICCIVTTTTGKNYSSNKFSKQHIVGHINVASEMNNKL
jgi:hypothetical protein